MDEEDEEALKSRLILRDDALGVAEVRLVGGLDVAYAKGSDGVGDMAVACLVVLTFPSLQRCYTDTISFEIQAPYAPGFLARREAPAMIHLLERVKERKKSGQEAAVPDVVLVDGNGTMHPRRFGIACRVGVVADVPAIGVSKNFLALEDLDAHSTKEAILARMAPTEDLGEDTALPAHERQCVLHCIDDAQVGCAVMAPSSRVPVFVSPGHRVSLQTAVSIVRRSQVYRIPEPIRHADAEARAALRRHISGGKGR